MQRVVLLLVVLLGSCERAPNYNIAVPGGRADQVVDAEAGTPSAEVASSAAGAERTAEVPAAASSSSSRTSVQTGSATAHASASEGTGPAVGPPKSSVDSSASGAVAPHEVIVAHARDPKFDELRALSRRYRQLQTELNGLMLRISQSGLESDRQRYLELERQIRREWDPINEYIRDQRWSALDRASMTYFVRTAQPD